MSFGRKITDEEKRKLPPKKRFTLSQDQSLPVQNPKRVKVEAPETTPVITVAQTSLFKKPLPVVKTKKNPLRSALETHFRNMRPETLAKYHFSEILREIADFHRARRNTFTDKQVDMFATILFTYEKACLIEPLNNEAKQRFESYQKIIQPKFDALIFVQGNLRKSKYLSELLNLGVAKFFWMSIDKYIERVQANYPDASNQEFADLCTHLLSAASVVRMRQKHMTPDQQETAIAALHTSIDSFKSESTGRLSFTTPSGNL